MLSDGISVIGCLDIVQLYMILIIHINKSRCRILISNEQNALQSNRLHSTGSTNRTERKLLDMSNRQPASEKPIKIN